MIKRLLVTFILSSALNCSASQTQEEPIVRLTRTYTRSACTGYAIYKDGKKYGVTAGHCCDEKPLDYNSKPMKILSFDKEKDTCIFKAPKAKTLTYRSEIPYPGELLSILGIYNNVFKLKIVTMLSIIDKEIPDDKGKKIVFKEIYKMSGLAIPGVSGSPVIDHKGRVVGTVLGTNREEGWVYIVPIQHTLDLIDVHSENK